MPGEDVHRLVDVNLTAVIELTRLALPHLLSRGDGDVVITSSIAAFSQVPPLTVYCATKAGVQGFANGLRREVSTRGVRVHTVNPAMVRTEWLARGSGYQPQEGEGSQRESPGIDPDRVAGQIEKCLRSRWPRVASVPRIAGLARLGEVPPVNRVLDLVVSSQAHRIAGLARAEARKVTQPPHQVGQGR